MLLCRLRHQRRAASDNHRFVHHRQLQHLELLGFQLSFEPQRHAVRTCRAAVSNSDQHARQRSNLRCGHLAATTFQLLQLVLVNSATASFLCSFNAVSISVINKPSASSRCGFSNGATRHQHRTAIMQLQHLLVALVTAATATRSQQQRAI